jgi:uncharacterized damage-inducible protein DinB
MINSIEQFKKDWQTLTDGTSRILKALTDASLSQKVGEKDRTLGRIAWHIVQTIPEMADKTGLKIDGPDEKSPVPASIEEIRAGYTAVTGSLLEQITKNWTDETLLQEDELYGETWKRGLTLRILMDHEIHHRGQMTVLMRQAGLVVPGIYGPAREEWSQYGMEEPEI